MDDGGGASGDAGRTEGLGDLLSRLTRAHLPRVFAAWLRVVQADRRERLQARVERPSATSRPRGVAGPPPRLVLTTTTPPRPVPPRRACSLWWALLAGREFQFQRQAGPREEAQRVRRGRRRGTCRRATDTTWRRSKARSRRIRPTWSPHSTRGPSTCSAVRPQRQGRREDLAARLTSSRVCIHADSVFDGSDMDYTIKQITELHPSISGMRRDRRRASRASPGHRRQRRPSAATSNGRTSGRRAS